MKTLLCSPALIYLVFTLVHIIIFIYQNKVNEVIIQILIGTLITGLLQILCLRGMEFISWIIVLIPFVLYTYIGVILFDIFGLNPKTNVEKINIPCNNSNFSEEEIDNIKSNNESQEKLKQQQLKQAELIEQRQIALKKYTDYISNYKP